MAHLNYLDLIFLQNRFFFFKKKNLVYLHQGHFTTNAIFQTEMVSVHVYTNASKEVVHVENPNLK